MSPMEMTWMPPTAPCTPAMCPLTRWRCTWTWMETTPSTPTATASGPRTPLQTTCWPRRPGPSAVPHLRGSPCRRWGKTEKCLSWGSRGVTSCCTLRLQRSSVGSFLG
uniref:Alternative protein JUP n=1 Tax=Homo sapiens TaxID=9606 RepID=L8EAA6_HUMAN|nr:alternative protein JUP [Homo sapiens]